MFQRIKLRVAGPAVLAAGLIISTGGGQIATLASGTQVAGKDMPGARAIGLGLPKPTQGVTAATPACARDIQNVFPTACFPQRQDASDYITGRSHLPVAAHSIQLSGYGGQAANTAGGYEVALTCQYSPCGGNTEHWYLPYNAITYCTHAYPYNDYYGNAALPFTVFNNYLVGPNAYNCNRSILYYDTTQGGAGALDCGSLGVCYSSYSRQSWSLQNR